MANIKSNIKTKRKSDKKNSYNRSYVKTLKTQIKKVQKTEDVASVYQAADSLAAKGIIHKNKAARIKSRNMRKATANNVKA